MKLNPGEQRSFEAEIARLIRTGKMPSLEQVQAAIVTTREKYLPLILAARAEETRTKVSEVLCPSPRNVR